MLSSEKIESSRIPSTLFLLSTILLTAATRTILEDKHTAEDYQREPEPKPKPKPESEPKQVTLFTPAGAKAPASILSPITPRQMGKESTSKKSELEEILDHLDSLFTNDLIKEKIAPIDRYIYSNNFSTLNDLNELNKDLNKYGITVLSNSISINILSKINDETRSEKSNLEELLYNLENISVIDTQMMMDILASIDAAIESKDFSNLSNHGIIITPDTISINIAPEK